jgi:hypothetical protein
MVNATGVACSNAMAVGTDGDKCNVAFCCGVQHMQDMVCASSNAAALLQDVQHAIQLIHGAAFAAAALLSLQAQCTAG